MTMSLSCVVGSTRSSVSISLGKAQAKVVSSLIGKVVSIRPCPTKAPFIMGLTCYAPEDLAVTEHLLYHLRCGTDAVFFDHFLTTLPPSRVAAVRQWIFVLENIRVLSLQQKNYPYSVSDYLLANTTEPDTPANALWVSFVKGEQKALVDRLLQGGVDEVCLEASRRGHTGKAAEFLRDFKREPETDPIIRQCGNSIPYAPVQKKRSLKKRVVRYSAPVTREDHRLIDSGLSIDSTAWAQRSPLTNDPLFVSESASEPISLTLLVDLSDSMLPRRNELERFIEKLCYELSSPIYELRLLGFSSSDCGKLRLLEWQKFEIPNLDGNIGGCTPLHLALDYARGVLQGSRGRKFLVVVTDGSPYYRDQGTPLPKHEIEGLCSQALGRCRTDGIAVRLVLLSPAEDVARVFRNLEVHQSTTAADMCSAVLSGIRR